MRTHLHDLLLESAGPTPDAPALTYGDRSLSYAELADDVRRIAAGLIGLGVRRHDRGAVLLDKRIETVAAMFPAAAAAAVFVPVNPVFKPPQVAHVLADCDVRVLVTTTAR